MGQQGLEVRRPRAGDPVVQAGCVQPPGLVVAAAAADWQSDLHRVVAGAQQAAARALLENSDVSAREIVEKGLNIAADICVYTNHNLVLEELEIQD